MQKNKVNDYCEFPTLINFKPWTKEGIKEREKLLGQNGGQNGNGTSDRIPNNEENQQLDEAEDEEMIQDEEQSVIIESDQEDEKKAGEPIDLDIESNEDDID